MINRTERSGITLEKQAEPDNRSAITLAIVILAIMAVAIAVDTSSTPGLAILTVVLLGSLITALAFWG